MDERLTRRTPSSAERLRYGRWELSTDQAEARGPEPRPEDPEQRRAEEEEARRLMIKQRRLSLTAAASVAVMVFAVVIAGYVWTGWMTRPLWHGFSPLFLFVGILIYPLTWVVAILYTVISNQLDGLS